MHVVIGAITRYIDTFTERDAVMSSLVVDVHKVLAATAGRFSAHTCTPRVFGRVLIPTMLGLSLLSAVVEHQSVAQLQYSIGAVIVDVMMQFTNDTLAAEDAVTLLLAFVQRYEGTALAVNARVDDVIGRLYRGSHTASLQQDMLTILHNALPVDGHERFAVLKRCVPHIQTVLQEADAAQLSTGVMLLRMLCCCEQSESVSAHLIGRVAACEDTEGQTSWMEPVLMIVASLVGRWCSLTGRYRKYGRLYDYLDYLCIPTGISSEQTRRTAEQAAAIGGGAAVCSSTVISALQRFAADPLIVVAGLPILTQLVHQSVTASSGVGAVACADGESDGGCAGDSMHGGASRLGSSVNATVVYLQALVEAGLHPGQRDKAIAFAALQELSQLASLSELLHPLIGVFLRVAAAICGHDDDVTVFVPYLVDFWSAIVTSIARAPDVPLATVTSVLRALTSVQFRSSMLLLDDVDPVVHVLVAAPKHSPALLQLAVDTAEQMRVKFQPLAGNSRCVLNSIRLQWIIFAEAVATSTPRVYGVRLQSLVAIVASIDAEWLHQRQQCERVLLALRDYVAADVPATSLTQLVSSALMGQLGAHSSVDDVAAQLINMQRYHALVVLDEPLYALLKECAQQQLPLNGRPVLRQLCETFDLTSSIEVCVRVCACVCVQSALLLLAVE